MAHIITRIFNVMVSGIRFVWGLGSGSGMYEFYAYVVYVVFGARFTYIYIDPL